MHLLEPDVDLLTRAPCPEPGHIFDMRPTPVAPLTVHRVLDLVFPSAVMLGRARESRPGERLAFLVHGLAMNEDYFGLLVPELVSRGYDVWALRLPGYLASGQRPSAFWPVDIGFSVAFYGWVTASALAHLIRTSDEPPREVLGWGHSLGAVALASAVASCVGPEWAGVDRLVFEAPAFSEAIAFSGAIIAMFSTFPTSVLDVLARGLLMDDLRSSDFAKRQCLPFVPGRTSRLMFTMNVLALVNPFSRTPKPPPAFLARTRFIVAEFDRLVDHDRLNQLLDSWEVPSGGRLVLPRNHLLSLTSARQMLEWVEGTWDGC